MKYKTAILLITLILTNFLPMTNGFENNNYLDDYRILYPTDDTYVKNSKPDNNYGNDSKLNIRNNYGFGGNPGFSENLLIKFNLSLIPNDITVKSAILEIYYFDWSDNLPEGREISAYKIIEEWDEITVTWNNKPDIYEIPTNKSIIPSSIKKYMTWDVTNDIQNFLIGGDNNFGWELIDQSYWGEYYIPRSIFLSKEYGSFKPKLKIFYEYNNKPPNTPEIPTGNLTLFTNESGIYYTSSDDPEYDKISYGWDWNGDDIVDEWSQFYISGLEISTNHSWEKTTSVYRTIYSSILNDK